MYFIKITFGFNCDDYLTFTVNEDEVYMLVSRYLNSAVSIHIAKIN